VARITYSTLVTRVDTIENFPVWAEDTVIACSAFGAARLVSADRQFIPVSAADHDAICHVFQASLQKVGLLDAGGKRVKVRR